jgi:hypothetical protein
VGKSKCTQEDNNILGLLNPCKQLRDNFLSHSAAWRSSTPPARHLLLTEPGEPDHKETDMTDTTNKPIDDSKEELTEAELDKVAGGGANGGGVHSTEGGGGRFGVHAEVKTLKTPFRATVGPDVVKKDPHGAV